MELPEVVFIKLTSKCNNNCAYCYDSKKHPENSLSEIKKLIEFLSKNGAKAVVLTGGEPLLKEGIDQILAKIKKEKMKIYLDTSGDFFYEHKEAIDKYVDILGLPIDYSEDNKSYRSSQNLSVIKKILEYYTNKKNKVKIRIGTVATRDNIGELEKIGNLISKFNIDMWKVYQFIPAGSNGYKNRKKLTLSTELFLKKTKKLEKKYSSFFTVVISPRRSRKKAYFFLRTDGTVFMPMDTKEIHDEKEIGNIYNPNIMKIWLKEVQLKRYLTNIKRTFNQKKNSKS